MASPKTVRRPAEFGRFGRPYRQIMGVGCDPARVLLQANEDNDDAKLFAIVKGPAVKTLLEPGMADEGAHHQSTGSRRHSNTHR